MLSSMAGITTSDELPDDVVERFESERPRLVGLAYRILGTHADAEDAVQDAWLRLQRTGAGTVDDLPAWLTTVTSRLCLDRLRAARVAREVYVGPWLPEPLVEPAPGPAERVEADESLRVAFLVVLDELTPEQRVAFVLHDLFAVPFDAVADSLGTTSAAARQLASRARRAVRAATPPPAPPLEQQRSVLEALVTAVQAGDLERLVGVLAPDVVLRSDGGGVVGAALRAVHGPDKVARLVLGLAAKWPAEEVVPVLVNGELGVVVRGPGPAGEEVTVLVAHAGPDGLVHSVTAQRNPAKLGRLPLA